MPQPDPMPSGFEATLLQVHRQQRMALESYQLLTKQHEVWQRSVEQLLTKAHEVPRSPLLVAPPPCSLFTAEPFQLPEAETPPDSMPLSQMSPTGADRAESNRPALALSKSTVERFQGPDKKGGPLKKIVAELREEQEARERKKEEKGFWRKLQRNVSELVLSRWFEYVTGLVILLNMVTIGIEVELSAHGTSESWAVDAERVFLALYTIEITLRIIGLGTKNLTILWFYLDFFLVAIGLLARVAVPVFGLGDLAGFEKLLLVRCLRLLRLVRALRMISHFKVMWRLVYSLLTAGQTLLSTAVLTLLALFIFGCVALEFITKDLALKEHPETGPIVQDYFDTLPMAILTLTQFVTLDSVAQIYYPLIVQLGIARGFWVCRRADQLKHESCNLASCSQQ